MSIYKFKREDAFRFAEFVGAKYKTVRGKELQFTECPYCHNKKDKNTFSINLDSGAFVCLRASCNAKGNMLTLHRDFNFDLGMDLTEYERELSTWRRYRRQQQQDQPKSTVIDYLYKERRIEPEIIAKYGISTKKGTENVIAFPFEGITGYVEFIKYRKTDFNPDKDKNKEWCEPNMRPILFGMAQCNEENSTLIITEGQIDSLTVASCGFENAVSVPTGKKGFTWIPHCWDWLHKFTEIIVFGDYEHGEVTLLADIKSRFDWMNVKSVRPECYKGCKDANEIYRKYGRKAIEEAINTAAAELPERIKRIEDIGDEEENCEKLPLGIEKVDNTLNGGLPFGAFNILTGKRGEGKSTEASMIVKSAIAHGYTTFIYSGELDKRVQKKWLDLQIAGRDHIDTIDNGWQKKYQISKANMEIIRNYYRDMVYLYDTSVISDETADLIPTIKRCIVQFGCRVILIDNLMTAIDIFDNQGGEKGERQERLCKTLARMAMEYNVLILLVAHKKKQQGNFPTDENDAVLGSSEITNLADAVLSYERPKQADIDKGIYTESQRIIKITKNRSGNGQIDFKGVTCNYCEVSKRIYGNLRKEEDTPTRPESCFMNMNTDDVDFREVDLNEIPFA